MPRPLRIDRPGGWHHVFNRGARREPVFRTEDHCLAFLRVLEEAVEHHGLEVHAFALMPNHYHLLVRTRRGSLSRSMRHVNAVYTQRTNRLYGWDGPVFRGRFRSQPVEEERYLDHLFGYVHLNPVRAGLVRRPEDARWTSLRAYLRRERAPSWLRTEYFGHRLGGAGGILKVMRALHTHAAELPETIDPETGWIRGVDRPVERSGAGVSSPEPASAEQILRCVAGVVGVRIADLKRSRRGRGGAPERRLAVWALSRSHSFSHREIAHALAMSETHVARVLWSLRSGGSAQLASWMAEMESRKG